MFLDIGVGIITAILINKDWILLSVIFALLPDLDFILYVLEKGNTARAFLHRDLLHRPIPYILIGGIFLFFLNPTWSLIFCITSLLHFIHDSVGIGWGVEWLWPIKNDHFAFFYLYSPPHAKFPKRLIYHWKHTEIPSVAAEYGDKKWVRNVYFKWHPIAIFEFVFFLFSLFIFYLSK